MIISIILALKQCSEVQKGRQGVYSWFILNFSPLLSIIRVYLDPTNHIILQEGKHVRKSVPEGQIWALKLVRVWEMSVLSRKYITVVKYCPGYLIGFSIWRKKESWISTKVNLEGLLFFSTPVRCTMIVVILRFGYYTF